MLCPLKGIGKNMQQYEELCTHILVHLVSGEDPRAMTTTADLSVAINVENGVFFETCVNQCRDMGFLDVRGGEFAKGQGRGCCLTENGIRRARLLIAKADKKPAISNTTDQENQQEED
jgi:hypothetical protein